MSKPPRDFLQHVLDSIRLIHTYTDGLTLEQFMASPQGQDAVIRRIEVNGEAVKNWIRR